MKEGKRGRYLPPELLNFLFFFAQVKTGKGKV